MGSIVNALAQFDANGHMIASVTAVQSVAASTTLTPTAALMPANTGTLATGK